MSIKAVIFDLDGTLLNTLGDLTGAVNAALRRRGYPLLTEEDVRQRLGNGVRRLIARSLPEGADDGLIDACLADFQAHYDAHLVERTHPYAGIPTVIEGMTRRGVRMAVLSNKYHAATCRLVAHYFPGQMAVTLGERPGVPRKPDPTSTREILRLLDAAPEEVLYVGDSDVDMQTARSAGVTAVGALWGFRSRESLVAAGAEHLVEAPEELITLLDRLQLDEACRAFEARGFTCTFCATAAQAADYLTTRCAGKSVAFGGSVTLDALGVYDALRDKADVHWHWKGDAGITSGDVYLTSANAVSAMGEIVNIDGTCNRVAGSLYGFDACYVVCGVNKLTPDLTSAMRRARTIAAPLNARRLGKRTPCAVDGKCHDCRSPERICRAMAVLMAPPARMRHYEIVLIGEELGY